MAIERDQSGFSDRTELIDQYMICRLFDEDWALPLAVEGLLGSVRTVVVFSPLWISGIGS